MVTGSVSYTHLFKRLTAVALSLAMVLPGAVPAYAAPERENRGFRSMPGYEELMAADYTLYLVKCGASNPLAIPNGYKMGVLQSGTDQKEAPDSTGYTWGYVENGTSIMSVSYTHLDVYKRQGREYEPGQNDSEAEREVLALPYTDDFEYAQYEADEKGRTYLERRGGTPRYTTDLNGAFEVQEGSFGNHVLTQVINDNNRPYDWNVWGNGTDENSQTSGRPRTVLGDHRWTNYVAGIDFKLDLTSPECFENYAGIGVREVAVSYTHLDVYKRQHRYSFHLPLYFDQKCFE